MTSESSLPDSTKSLSDARYGLIRRLGAGGMGEVLLALDRHVGVEVVIKIPHRALLRDAGFAARFQREIKSLIKLRHRNIVAVTDVGSQKGLPYVVMPYLAGGSLRDRLNDGPLPESSLANWLPAVADALDHVHSLGFIHRDIKPGNILFDNDGAAYLGDFGVAKAIGAQQQSSETNAARLTGTGMAMGTPDYMAPELIMSEKVDHRADQYALACTVYEVLSGRLPFEAPTPAAVLVKQSTMPAPDLRVHCPEASESLIAAVDRALSKPPQDRFRSCGEFCVQVLSNTASGSGSPDIRRTLQVSRLSCPCCSNELVFRQRHAGKIIGCSGCQAKFRVSNDLAGLTSEDEGERAPQATTRSNCSSARTDAFHPVAAAQSANEVGKFRLSVSKAAILGILSIGSCLAGIAIVTQSFAPERQMLDAETESESESIDRVGVTTTAAKNRRDTSVAQSIPAILKLKPRIINEETPLDITVSSSTPLGDSVRLRLAPTAPDGMQLNSETGRLYWIPSEDQGPGTFTAEIQITDLSSKTVFDSELLTVDVRETNRPPVILQAEPVIANSGDTVSVQLQATDVDVPQDTLRFSLAEQSLDGVTIDAVSGELR